MFSEPNVVSHTAHSVTRKGVKKRDLSDIELREILSDLLPWVRMDHVLPPNSEVLIQAIRRGLVSTPPSHMIGGERENLRVNAWIRGSKNNGLFVQPRLFIPYYDELKVLVEDQLVQEAEMLRGRRVRCGPDPDISYMIETRGGSSGVDVLGGAPPVPDAGALNAMLKREQKLRQAPGCQLALSMPLSSRVEIGRQIRLRVVREFNLPDNVAEALEAYRVGTQTEEGSSTGRRSPARRRLATPPRRMQEPPDRLPDVAMGPSSLGPPPAPSELRLDLGDGPPPRSAYRLYPPGPTFASSAPVPRFL